MSKDERLGWIGLNMVPGLGPRRIRHLVDCFQGAQKAWRAPEHLLAQASRSPSSPARSPPPFPTRPAQGTRESP